MSELLNAKYVASVSQQDVTRIEWELSHGNRKIFNHSQLEATIRNLFGIWPHYVQRNTPDTIKKISKGKWINFKKQRFPISNKIMQHLILCKCKFRYQLNSTIILSEIKKDLYLVSFIEKTIYDEAFGRESNNGI